jgi:FMN-dependent NADH-azoreductase
MVNWSMPLRSLQQLETLMKLLQVDSSARGSSVSRAMTAEFVAAWRREHPHGEVVTRDLARLPLGHVTDEWVKARDTHPESLSAEQRKELSLSDQLIDELVAADVIVLGSPMYNFNISAALKAWIDLIVRQGRTVDFTVRPPKGLLQSKKLVVITARGGTYAAGTPTASFDFQEPYLRHIFGLLGFDVSFIHTDRQLYGPEIAATSKQEAKQQIGALISELTAAAA